MESPGIAPNGLGKGVDRYLDAHGYDAGSRLHIMHAWQEYYLQDFVAYFFFKSNFTSIWGLSPM
jgi:hypothetical protein